MTQPEPLTCPTCGESDFEWGNIGARIHPPIFRVDGMSKLKWAFIPDDRTFVRGRRCVACGNVQLFTAPGRLSEPD